MIAYNSDHAISVQQKEKKMLKIGDSVQVQIGGGQQGLTLEGGQTSIGIGSGASMSVPGRIIQDLGDRWLVQLSISLGGQNTIAIPKDQLAG